MTLQRHNIVMRKYRVGYYFCGECGLLQTETPYWLNEAYSDVIARSDTGLVTRNISLAVRLAAVLGVLIDPHASYADVGGGYGMLTRLMRDIGFDYYWSDPFCDNLFAKDFDAQSSGLTFRGITAFEVMEHIHDPMTFIRTHMEATGARTFIFSTQLFEGAEPPPDSWSYYVFPTGQHVTFYQRRTLDRMAAILGLSCYSSGFFHMLTSERVSPTAFRMLSSRASLLALPLLRARLRSRTIADSQAALEQIGLDSTPVAP